MILDRGRGAVSWQNQISCAGSSGLARRGKGWDYPYAGWYLRLQGLADAGWLPVVLSDDARVVYDQISLRDVRPKGWRRDVDEEIILPLPPAGELQQDYNE